MQGRAGVGPYITPYSTSAPCCYKCLYLVQSSVVIFAPWAEEAPPSTPFLQCVDVISWCRRPEYDDRV